MSKFIGPIMNFSGLIILQFIQIMINQAQLLKKLRLFSVVQPILQASRLSKLKLANQIYSKRHIRDINKFIRQTNDIIRKTNQRGQQKRIKTLPNQLKGRYDDNQLKELSFQFQSVKQKYLTHDFPDGFDVSKFAAQNLEAMNRKREAYKNKLNEAGKFNLKKRITLLGNINHNATNFNNTLNNPLNNGNVTSLNPIKLNRLKSLSVYSHTSIQSPQVKPPLSPTRLRRRGTILEIPEAKISLKQEQIQKALNNLISLIGTPESKNYFIDRQLIFEKIEQKYKLKISILEQQLEYKHSLKINKGLNEKKYKTQIPYCQFNNLKDSRASIDRIFNMPVKAAQRIAFKLYDRNGNGIIDQKDIIQLFSIAQHFSAMQQDMEIIIKNYKVASQGALISDGRGSKSPRKSFKKADISDFSIDKMNKIQVIQEQNAKQQGEYSSGKFRKSNYFTFKQTKQQFFQSKKNPTSSSIMLTWQGFQQAFANLRPQIYYDLLDFLFNIDSQMIYEKATKMASQQQAKSNRFMLFNNSDGKSESGSNYNLEAEIDTGRKLIKKHEKSTITKTSKKTRNDSNIQDRQMTTKKIETMIDKAKSIEQFQSLKYNT